MANPPAQDSPAVGLVAGSYVVDFEHILPGAADPLTAFAARDERTGQGGLMAVQVQRGWPARARVLASLAGDSPPNLLQPLAHGPALMPSGETTYVVVCPAPPGPSVLSTLRPWSEADLMDYLVKPVAAALMALQSRNVTHRAIRPGNLFQVAPKLAVTLGCAWAAPPACYQPDWMEPVYSATCQPCGRGDGTVADDVYALGALLLMLALGANPTEGIPADVVMRRKLDVGSYAAIAGSHHLPVGVTELARGMLADDPEHRPSPALLRDPPSARARRIAARPPRRAQRPLEVGPEVAWTPRMLAHTLQRQPAQGVLMLRSGAVDRWLRRGVGDTGIAGRVDEVVRLREAEAASSDQRADSLLITRAIVTLDPLAPMVWRSGILWPDGLGPALDHALHHAPGQVDSLVEIVLDDISRAWADRRVSGREGPASLRLETRDVHSWLLAGRSGGTLRLAYMLNPLAPCESPLTAGHWITRLPELLPALEATAARSPRKDQPLVDSHIVAFVAARRDERLDTDIGRLAGAVGPADLFSQLRLLAALQTKLVRGALPHLSRWAAEAIRPRLDSFNSRSRRVRLEERLKQLGEAGQLPDLVALLDDQPEQSQDQEGLRAARARLITIDATLAQLQTAAGTRAKEAKQIAYEVAGGVGLVACVVALGFAVFT